MRSKAQLRQTLSAEIDKHNSLEHHQRKPNIPIGPLGGRIEEEVAQRVENFIEREKAALQARIDALKLMGEARRAAVNRVG